MYGQDVEYRRQLLIVVLERKQHFNTYFNLQFDLVGAYAGWLEKEIVFCHQSTVEALSDPHQQLEGLLGYHFFFQEKGFLAPPWLSLIINAHTGFGDDKAALSRAHRALQAEIKTGCDSKRPPLLGLSKRDLPAILRNRDLKNSQALASLIWQGRSVAAFLMREPSGRYREQFVSQLRELTRRKESRERLKQFFTGGDGVVHAWRDWMLQQKPGPHQAPPPAIERQMVEHTIPAIHDVATDPMERARLVHKLGAAGYVLGAKTLIDIVHRDLDPLKPDAIWGLTVMSGQAFEDDADRWQSWWDALPDDVKSPRNAIVPAREIPARGGPLHPDHPVGQRAPSVGRSTSDQHVAVAQLVPEPDDAQPANVDSPATAALSARAVIAVPGRLKTVWSLMTIGGVIAIALSMNSLFSVVWDSHLLWYMPWAALSSYYGIWMGTIAVARGTSRNVTALHGTTTAQMINLVNCDVINLALGLIERQLLRSRETARYLEPRE